VVLEKYSREWVVHIEDITSFVREQHQHVIARRYEDLLTPRETVYAVTDEAVAKRLGISVEI